MDGNLLTSLPPSGSEELFTTLVEGQGLRLERIVSSGHTTPAGEWYDQEWAEWVVVLQGAAVLRFADDEQPHRLRTGDHLLIPAHRKHRVDWTDPNQHTVWLALHFAASGT